MSGPDDLTDALGALALFADLGRAQLEEVAHTFEEQAYAEGQRVVRQDFSGTGFHLILDGEASVRVDGQERARLGRGEYFGEVSLLLEENSVADVVSLTPLRCAVLAGSELHEFLLAHPSVAYRMLQAQARRLRDANRWRS